MLGFAALGLKLLGFWAVWRGEYETGMAINIDYSNKNMINIGIIVIKSKSNLLSAEFYARR